ncbi:ferric reductase-like transmembrane domain-containing protein [Gymnodinialimonas sp. 2305UL16-5]|uniref:ferric reductase-like transmembrane domain-containing protein n=1 Tax=Gymnodinialimonas mytili TaxID=3126503 RepID=UPI0030B0CDCB
MARVLIWLGLAAAIATPIGLAALSPLLAWRDPIYVVAGFAGILGLTLMLIQPLLAAGLLPGLDRYRSRHVHRWTGIGLVLAIIVHVVGLWITSPPDVIDALTFTSPTPFAAWGVVAMWAAFGAATLALMRRRLRLRTWRIAHTTTVTIVVAGTIVHAVLIQGTMEPITKAALCGLVGLTTLAVIARLRPWRRGRAGLN